MNQTECPYTKVSSVDATKIAFNTDFTTFNSNFSLVSKAEAQSTFQETAASAANSVSQQLSMPFLMMVLFFFLFVILMSVVYVYHWIKFGMHDPRIHTFMSIYFIGLIVLIIPVIYNLIF